MNNLQSNTNNVELAYQRCFDIAKQHYENFPTASYIFHKNYRPAVAAIYAFARTADDFADEGDIASDIRYRQLDHLATFVQTHKTDHLDYPLEWAPAFVDSVVQHSLPEQPFLMLLSAFKQDINTRRYNTEQQLLDYCQRSANPVGRLILYLHGFRDETLLSYSDAICTSLQLINFVQDIGDDYLTRDRIYIPIEDFQTLGIDISQVKLTGLSEDILQKIAFLQLSRAFNILTQGIDLIKQTRGRLRFFLKVTIFGALRLIGKLLQRENTLTQVKLNKIDAMNILFNSTFKHNIKNAIITVQNNLTKKYDA